MLMLIGSRATDLRVPGLLNRPLVDWDFIGCYDDIQEFLKRHREKFAAIYPEGGGRKIIARADSDKLICEFDIAWEGTAARELLEAVESGPRSRWDRSLPGCFQIENFDNELVFVPSLDQLYTLKLSHRYLKNSPHFWKTIADVKAYRAAGAKIWSEEWLKRRESETYTYKHPKLNMSKENFFSGDGVVYTYDHDTIHESMKHLERPAYTYFKPADREVLCDKGMFFAADEKVRLFSVLEEAQVLALERSQIPFPGVLTPEQSFKKALMKVCSSITSGWWREWAWEHHDEVYAMHESDYVDRFWRAVESGVVKKLQSKGETDV